MEYINQEKVKNSLIIIDINHYDLDKGRHF